MTWYALRTAPMKEFAVETILKDRDLLAFCPTEVRYRFVGKKKVPHDYAMLARYLFASGDDLLSAVLRLKDRGLVNGLVGINGMPAPIPDAAILRLARMSGGSIPTKAPSVRKSFAAGDTVEVMDGCFKGALVPIESINGKTARVLMKMFNSEERPVDIPLESLEAA
mgnify:CR=1 FL=1